MKTAAAVAWEAAAKISLLVLLAFYFCSLEGVAAACIAAAPGVEAARAAAVASAAGVAAAQRGGGPEDAIRPSRWWSSGYRLSVSHGPKANVPRNPDEKKQRKTNNLR